MEISEFKEILKKEVPEYVSDPDVPMSSIALHRVIDKVAKVATSTKSEVCAKCGVPKSRHLYYPDSDHDFLKVQENLK